MTDFSKLEQWFEEKYDADVMFSDDVFYPDNKDEWIYRFGVESSPQGKRGQAQRQLNPVSGNASGVADRIYDSFINNQNTEDYIRGRQDLKFYDKLINKDIARQETLEFGRELAIAEFRSGNRREAERFLSEHFGVVLGGLLRGESQTATKGFRQTFS